MKKVDGLERTGQRIVRKEPMKRDNPLAQKLENLLREIYQKFEKAGETDKIWGTSINFVQGKNGLQYYFSGIYCEYEAPTFEKRKNHKGDFIESVKMSNVMYDVEGIADLETLEKACEHLKKEDKIFREHYSFKVIAEEKTVGIVSRKKERAIKSIVVSTKNTHYNQI